MATEVFHARGHTNDYSFRKGDRVKENEAGLSNFERTKQRRDLSIKRKGTRKTSQGISEGQDYIIGGVSMGVSILSWIGAE